MTAFLNIYEKVQARAMGSLILTSIPFKVTVGKSYKVDNHEKRDNHGKNVDNHENNS